MIKRGLPTVVLVNEHFLMEAQLIARSRGMAALSMVITPQNIEFLSAPEIEAIADRACEEAAKLLTQPKKAVPAE